MGAYEALAASYDRLTNDVDYGATVAFYREILEEEGLHPRTAVDLACGTGSVSVLLAQQGSARAELGGGYLAGGFGVYLDPASAAAIGMLPQLPAGRLHSIGNASLAGASMLALDASRAADALQTAERCRYIELSGRADFADAFTGGMTYEPVTRR